MSVKTMLYRQIHPNFVNGDSVMSIAFCPTPNDPCKLSVYDGDQITPKDAWKHYTKQLKSDGVMAVTVGECESRSICVIFDKIPYKEHAFIDFGGYGKKEIRTASRHLKRIAQAPGWLFRPDWKDVSAK